ncbi:MAG: TlpA family protein disulfide reductase, partial [Rubripirellula sp.]
FPGSPQAEIAEGAIRRMDSVGKRIDLRGKTLDGVNFQLSNLRGKLVVLHYWATWCSPCLQDMRALQQLQATYRNAKFEIIGINVDMTAAKTRQHLQQTKIPWIQLFEAGGLEGSGLSKALGIQTLPAMLLIDEDGRVVSNNLQVTDLQQELARRFR